MTVYMFTLELSTSTTRMHNSLLVWSNIFNLSLWPAGSLLPSLTDCIRNTYWGQTIIIVFIIQCFYSKLYTIRNIRNKHQKNRLIDKLKQSKLHLTTIMGYKYSCVCQMTYLVFYFAPLKYLNTQINKIMEEIA